MPSLEDFSYDAYSDLLRRLRKDRTSLLFRETRDTLPARFFLMRHDIDFCPKAALEMAKIEARMGVRATYFALFNSPFFNLLEPEHTAFVRALVDLGHEVGLHYDLSAIEAQAGAEPGAVPALFERYVALLESLTREPIQSIAMHLPSQRSQPDPFAASQRFISTYDSRFTKEIPYFSDSCGAWYDAALHALEGTISAPRLQVLTHPILWAPAAGDRWARLAAILESKQQQTEAHRQMITGLWQSHPAVIQHERRRSGGVVPTKPK